MKLGSGSGIRRDVKRNPQLLVHGNNMMRQWKSKGDQEGYDDR